jgi:hypothetical protein
VLPAIQCQRTIFLILIRQPCFIWQGCLQMQTILNIVWGQTLLLFLQAAYAGPCYILYSNC